MEAEKEMGQVKDGVIEELRSDKQHLQQQVARLEDLLKLQVEKGKKQGDQDNSGNNAIGHQRV